MRTDFLGLFQRMPPQYNQLCVDFRTFLVDNLGHTIDKHWQEGTFPKEFAAQLGSFLNEKLKDAYVFPPRESLPFRLLKLELGRFDPSMASFFAVHWGLAMGSIYMFGSAEQKEYLKQEIK